MIKRAVCLAAMPLRAVRLLLNCARGSHPDCEQKQTCSTLCDTDARASGGPCRHCTLIREGSGTCLARAVPCCGPQSASAPHSLVLSHASVRQAFFLGSSIILQAMGACPPCRPSCSQLSLGQHCAASCPTAQCREGLPKEVKATKKNPRHDIFLGCGSGTRLAALEVLDAVCRGLGVGVYPMLCSSREHVDAPQLRRTYLPWS